MAETRNAAAGTNSINWPLGTVLSTPLLTVLADINGKLLESAASAQKDWAEFVHRRVKEDIAVSQQLIGCKSLGDMQQVYSQYMRTLSNSIVSSPRGPSSAANRRQKVSPRRWSWRQENPRSRCGTDYWRRSSGAPRRVTRTSGRARRGRLTAAWQSR
jgi:hypothetical protein